MKHAVLSHIRGIIWDLDGTLYRYNQDFKNLCQEATARTVLEMGADVPYEEALALATESERLYGSSFKLFAERGFDYKDFHHAYHDKVDAALLEKNQALKAGLEALDLPMVILTNASRPWALRIVDHLEIDHIFGDGMILCLEDMAYAGKGSSSIGFEKGLALLDVPPGEALMVEDLARNLVMAKHLGMTTALVHQTNIVETNVDHVDIIFGDTIDLIRLLAAR